ncbi:MAG: monofunctional biosynthetic peptidoglycan transglycosylase [Spirochaetales bacterium]
MKALLAILMGGVLLIASFFATVLLCIVAFVWVNPGVSTLMVRRATQGTEIRTPRFVPLAQLPSYARTGILYLEDHNFYTHWGIVWGAIQEAWAANQRLGYEAYGGSTITQQLARTLFLTPDKNWIRKGSEAVIALMLEAVLSKDRILELYLNSIEWGPGVFGIEAAARYHYGTGVRNLDKEQLARLLAIVTSPVRFSVKTFAKNPGMVARYRALINR